MVMVCPKKKNESSKMVRLRLRCGAFFYSLLYPWLAYSARTTLSEKIRSLRATSARIIESEWITTSDDLTFFGIVSTHILGYGLMGYLIPKVF